MTLPSSGGSPFAPGAEEFALLVEAVEDYAIFLLSAEGQIRTWNRGAERIMGYPEDEVRGRHFSIFYGPESLAARKPWLELETAETEGRVEDEGWRVRKDGTRFWANTVITVLREPDGAVRGFAKITRDMTERRAAELGLRESTEIFQLLVSSVRDYAIFMLDPGGRVSTWNVGAERIKGYRPDEIIGRHFSTFYGEEDIRNGKPEWELEVARREGSVEDEGWRVRKDGSRFWALVVITAVFDAKGELKGFAKVTRDITERKRAEETQLALLEQREARLQAEIERRKAEDSYHAAREANRAKDQFLMMLSHELRTPMTAILGWARLLPSIPSDGPEFQDAVASIAAGAELQSRLIDDLLDVSRIISGKMRLASERVDLQSVIRNAVESVRSSAQARQISISTVLAPDLGTTIADATRLQQVLWNLLSNAVKFTPIGGSVQLTAERTPSEVRLSVTDTGEGIEPKFLPHVFEPFRQAEMSQTRSHGGLGLGLSIVHYIVEAHGGSVSAASEGPGKGSTFTVALPIRTDATPIGARGRTAENTLRGRLEGLDIVVVEDDDSARRMIEAVLRTAGANVVPFSSAQAALDSLGQRRPHVVLTDIAMPGMDGFAFVRALRERGDDRGVQIVALSAYPPRKGDTDLFNAYLSKPIDPVRLTTEIEKLASRIH
jgi:PAS domain S-box-containing protein